MSRSRSSHSAPASPIVLALFWLLSFLAACAPAPAVPTATVSAPAPTPPAAPTASPVSTTPPTPAVSSTSASLPTSTAASTLTAAATTATVGATPASASATAVPTAAPASAAAPASSALAPAGFPLTVTDDAGRKVTFDRPPQRIISLSPGHTETLYALGLGDRVVATDSYSDYPAANKPKATLKTYPKPPIEQIVADKPDLVLTLVEGNDFLQQMDQQGIKTLKLFPTSFDGTLKDISLIGQVTGTSDRAGVITSGMRERANAIVAKTKNAPKPVVVYELDASDPTKPFVAGPAGFYGDLIPMAGGKNAFDDLKTAAGQVSAEQILARDPDVIILGDSLVPFNPQTPQMVKSRPGWSGIKAVKNNRIVVVDDNLVSRPGPRLADGLAQLAHAIHPELFP